MNSKLTDAEFVRYRVEFFQGQLRLAKLRQRPDDTGHDVPLEFLVALFYPYGINHHHERCHRIVPVQHGGDLARNGLKAVRTVVWRLGQAGQRQAHQIRFQAFCRKVRRG